MALISKSSVPVKPRSREADAQVFAGRHAVLGVDVAPGGGQLQGLAVGAEPEVRVATGQVGAGAGESVGQADALALGVAERARDGPGEVERGASGG